MCNAYADVGSDNFSFLDDDDDQSTNGEVLKMAMPLEVDIVDAEDGEDLDLNEEGNPSGTSATGAFTDGDRGVDFDSHAFVMRCGVFGMTTAPQRCTVPAAATTNF